MTLTQTIGIAALIAAAGVVTYALCRAARWWLSVRDAADEQDDDPQHPARMTGA